MKKYINDFKQDFKNPELINHISHAPVSRDKRADIEICLLKASLETDPIKFTELIKKIRDIIAMR